MKIIPAIDMHEGNAVRLYKGDYNQVTIYGTPLEMALKFEKCHAKYIHLVDLDGAKDGSIKNKEQIDEIIKNSNLSLELGGGIRTLDKIKSLLDQGLSRVILGSIALDIEFVKKAIKEFGPDKIVIGLDADKMMIKTHGWLKDSNLNAYDYALKLKEVGVENIIFTDISKDGTLNGINVEETKKMVSTGLKIIASGGAKTIEDIKIAKEIGCDGIILGKSIYEGKIDLEKAIMLYGD